MGGIAYKFTVKFSKHTRCSNHTQGWSLALFTQWCFYPPCFEAIIEPQGLLGSHKFMVLNHDQASNAAQKLFYFPTWNIKFFQRILMSQSPGALRVTASAFSTIQHNSVAQASPCAGRLTMAPAHRDVPPNFVQFPLVKGEAVPYVHSQTKWPDAAGGYRV